MNKSLYISNSTLYAILYKVFTIINTILHNIEKTIDLLLEKIKHNINQTLPKVTVQFFARYINACINKSYTLVNHQAQLRMCLDIVTVLKLNRYTCKRENIQTQTNRSFPTANIITCTDYYPFGMATGGRNGSVESYRYGYQGSEKDDEIKGQGNYYTTFFRGLDPRLGKWLSVDPKASSLSWQSPYCSMDNNPVWFNDVLGDIFKIGKGDNRAKKDIKQLAGKNKKYININTKTGDVEFSKRYTKLSSSEKRTLESNKNFKLITDLITDNNKFLYSTSSNFNSRGILVGPKDFDNPAKFNFQFKFYGKNGWVITPDVRQSKFYLSMSTTEYGDGTITILPSKGFDGQVNVYTGSIYQYTGKYENILQSDGKTILRVPTTKSVRFNLIRHELKEVLLRTSNKLNYEKAHKQTLEYFNETDEQLSPDGVN